MDLPLSPASCLSRAHLGSKYEQFHERRGVDHTEAYKPEYLSLTAMNRLKHAAEGFRGVESTTVNTGPAEP